MTVSSPPTSTGLALAARGRALPVSNGPVADGGRILTQRGVGADRTRAGLRRLGPRGPRSGRPSAGSASIPARPDPGQLGCRRSDRGSVTFQKGRQPADRLCLVLPPRAACTSQSAAMLSGSGSGSVRVMWVEACPRCRRASLRSRTGRTRGRRRHTAHNRPRWRNGPAHHVTPLDAIDRGTAGSVQPAPSGRAGSPVDMPLRPGAAPLGAGPPLTQATMPGVQRSGQARRVAKLPADPLLLLEQGHGAVEIARRVEDDGLVAERDLRVAGILGHRGPSADRTRRRMGPYLIVSRRSARPQLTESNAPITVYLQEGHPTESRRAPGQYVAAGLPHPPQRAVRGAGGRSDPAWRFCPDSLTAASVFCFHYPRRVARDAMVCGQAACRARSSRGDVGRHCLDRRVTDEPSATSSGQTLSRFGPSAAVLTGVDPGESLSGRLSGQSHWPSPAGQPRNGPELSYPLSHSFQLTCASRGR